jgi:hypothetical protein
MVEEASMHAVFTDSSSATQPSVKVGLVQPIDVHVTTLCDDGEDIKSMPPPVNFSVSTVNACIQAERQPVQSFDELNCNVDTMNNLQLAKLNYVDINSPSEIVTALVDSGSELTVLRKDMLRGLNIHPLGEIEFRGIIGEAMEALL